MCFNGQIKGAAKLGREWTIPIDAQRPDDGRIASGDNKNWRNKKTEW